MAVSIRAMSRWDGPASRMDRTRSARLLAGRQGHDTSSIVAAT